MWLVLCGLAGLALAGCKKQDDITAYDEDKPGAAIAVAKNRIVAALFFRAENLWTFKLVGPEGNVKEVEPAFKDFLRSVHFDKKDEPQWKVPADGPKWSPEDKAENRFAGFKIGPKEDNVELTVVKLDRGKDRDSALLANVNRWRLQLALSKIGFDDMAGFVKPFDEQGAEKFYLVDLTGTGNGRTMPGGMGMIPGPRKPAPRSWGIATQSSTTFRRVARGQGRRAAAAIRPEPGETRGRRGGRDGRRDDYAVRQETVQRVRAPAERQPLAVPTAGPAGDRGKRLVAGSE